MRDDPNHTDSNRTTSTAIDCELLGTQLWEQIEELFVDWANAERLDNGVGAARIEQLFRRVALAYAILPADACTVSTGRKAIIRSIYERHGTVDRASVLGTLDAVIRREEATARGPS